MKKYVVAICLLILSGWFASAQENPQEDSQEIQDKKDKKEKKESEKYLRDSLNLQIFGGVNKSMNENMPITEWTKYPFAGGSFIGLAQEFRPLWGYRVTLGYDVNKSRNVEYCENPSPWKWKDMELFGDITFDFTDAISPRRPKRLFDLKLFAGIGGLWTWGFPQDIPLSYFYPYSRRSTLNFGVHAGITASVKVSRSLKIGAELSQTIATDRFNGVVDGKVPVDGRANLSVGLIWTPHKKRKSPEPPVERDKRLKTVPPLPYCRPVEKTGRFIEGRAYLDFPVSETVIYPEFGNNPDELRKIRESVEKIRFDKDLSITSITLHGTASPESPYSNNTRLAKGRTEALAGYLRKEYALPENLFKLRSTPEDWEDLESYVRDSFSTDHPDLERYRDTLLAVICSDVEPDAREIKLKEIGDGVPYRHLLAEVYPSLRRTDYRIEYAIREYTEEELVDLIYTDPESLTLEQMNIAAFSFPEGSQEKYRMLMIAVKHFPDESSANLNAACACIRTGRLRDAGKYLSRAGQSPQTEYLQKVIDAMEGKRDWYMADGEIVIE